MKTFIDDKTDIVYDINQKDTHNLSDEIRRNLCDVALSALRN